MFEQENVDSQDATNGPHIHLVAVSFLSKDLRSNIVRCTTQSSEPNKTNHIKYNLELKCTTYTKAGRVIHAVGGTLCNSTSDTFIVSTIQKTTPRSSKHSLVISKLTKTALFYLFFSPSISTFVASPKSPTFISKLSFKKRFPSFKSR